MKMRMIAALALLAGAVGLVAQEPNPYAKAKVGDYATFKTTTKLAGINVEGTITQTVIATDGKQATIEVTGKVNGTDLPQAPKYTIDLTKPFDPAAEGGALPPGVTLQVEKVKEDKERTEKVKVGSATHDARVEAYKAKVKAGGQDFESRLKLWLVKDQPFPIAKMELTADIDMQRLDVTMDLIETGNKPVEKKDPEKKDAKKE